MLRRVNCAPAVPSGRAQAIVAVAKIGIPLRQREAKPDLFAYLKGLADRPQSNASDADISGFCVKVLAARGRNLPEPELHAMARQRCRGGFAGSAPAQVI